MSFLGQMLKAGINPQGPEIIFNKPVIGSNLPTAFGNTYYVSKDGSDDNNGLDWSHALLTLEAAITIMRGRIDWSASPWSNNDVLYVGPGVYAENLTAMPHGCLIVGAGWDMRDGQFGSKIKPASGSPIDVGGLVNCGFINMGFEVADTSAIFDSEILNNCLFNMCYFTGPAETATAAAGLLVNDAVMNRIINCQFSCMDKGIDANYADGGDSFSHNIIEHCTFDQIDSAGIEISASLVGPSSKVLDCNFFGGGQTMGYAINDAIACIDVARCMAESTSGYNGVRSVNGSYNNGALVT